MYFKINTQGFIFEPTREYDTNNNDIVQNYLQTSFTSQRVSTKNLIIIVKKYFEVTPIHKSKVAITTELLFLKFTLVLLVLSLTYLK